MVILWCAWHCSLRGNSQIQYLWSWDHCHWRWFPGVTYWSDQTSGTHFSYNWLSLSDKDNSVSWYGLIILWMWMFSTVLHLLVYSHSSVLHYFLTMPAGFNFKLTFGLKHQVGGIKIIVTVYKRSIFQVEWLIVTFILFVTNIPQLSVQFIVLPFHSILIVILPSETLLYCILLFKFKLCSFCLALPLFFKTCKWIPRLSKQIVQSNLDYPEWSGPR